MAGHPEPDILRLLQRLMPLNRSLTGEGVRQSLDILSEVFPFAKLEYPSGTAVLDWIIPKEWRINSARLVDPAGRVVCDVTDHPLHLIGYSTSFSGAVDLAELKKSHLYTHPTLPDAIPYITSYYKDHWGFAISRKTYDFLIDGAYEVKIDTEHFDGHLTIGEAKLQGISVREVFFSSYICHPGMANDELCGPLVLSLLARRIAAWPERRLTYRFLLVPETIGSITYLAHNGHELKRNMIAGFTVANVGRDEPFKYKKSRQDNCLADRVISYLLSTSGFEKTCITPFAPVGSDERQYCSPGFNLPVGSLSRGDMFFEEYHSSYDTLDRIDASAIEETVDFLESACAILEKNRSYINQMPFCEPQLGRYGLYPMTGTTTEREVRHLSILWVLSFSDGDNDLLSIAERSGYRFDDICDAACELEAVGLLKPAPILPCITSPASASKVED
jgi:aminopeptidase-like protein